MQNETILKNMKFVNARYSRVGKVPKSVYWLRKDDHFIKGWKTEEELVSEKDLIIQLYNAICSDNFWMVYGYDEEREYDIKRQISFDGLRILYGGFSFES